MWTYKKMKVLVPLLLVVGFGGLMKEGAAEEEYKRICYFTNWSQYRRGHKKFQPKDIDASLCTHINYAFAQINESKRSFVSSVIC